MVGAESLTDTQCVLRGGDGLLFLCPLRSSP